MSPKMTAVVSVAMAAALWSASAQAQDLKVTNGAACVPTVTSTAVPSTATVVPVTGARFSTQVVLGGNGQQRPLTFVCPLVRDDLNTTPVTLTVRVNTFNALAPGTFTCKIKTVDQTGATIDESVDVFINQGFSSKVLNSGIFAVLPDHAYVLTCVVPNQAGTERSGIISYKWSETSF
jgi:hypothetical protein